MKRVRDLTVDDALTPTTDTHFHVPLSKRYRGDALGRRDEMRSCVHAHIVRALEVFSALATSAALHTDIPASTATVRSPTDSDGTGDSDEEKVFVLEMLGLDTSSDEEQPDKDCAPVINTISDQYSTSPPSFAQLDSGATKSISSCPNLFSYILLTPDTRIRVVDDHELSGVIGEGPLELKLRPFFSSICGT
jgi:hypothetical protein